MKKTLQRLSIVLLFVGLGLQSFAQGELRADGVKEKAYNAINNPVDEFKSKTDYANWRFPVDAVSQLTTLDRYVSFLYPDSSVQYVPASGDPYFFNWHSVGAVFSPNDPNLELEGDNIALSRYNEYTVDSVYFPYIYVRRVDSTDMNGTMEAVVDTLIVQFFKYDQLELGGFTPTGAPKPERFMKPGNWTQSLLGSNNTAYEIKIPLTIEDTTGIPSSEGWFSGQRVIPLPTDFNISSDAQQVDLEFKNTFGFSFSFKTMVPNNFGDTMEARNGATITNPVNYFGHSMFSNASIPVPQEDYINNSWWVPSSIAYGQDQNGWTNSVPGNAYFDDRYLNYAVHFATTTLGTEEVTKDITFGVYPNPISKNQALKADFNLVNASNVTIEIYDLLGNKVKDVANDYFTAGEHTFDVSVSDLYSGMYIYSVKAGNSVSSKKISIVE